MSWVLLTKSSAPDFVETKVTTTEDDQAALEALQKGRTQPSARLRLTDFPPANPGLFFVPRQ